ncbi:MAG: hypothetical protein IAF08_12155 [Rhizobacter sp.]|nr:hypothetical protein [Chlorobiales bacterium]
MKIKLLFEGESDRLALTALLHEDFNAAEPYAEFVKADYGGRRRGFTRILAREIAIAIEVDKADAVWIHIDLETDTAEKMQENLGKILSRVPEAYRFRVKFFVIHRNLESVLIAGCFEKERNYSLLENTKGKVRRVLRRFFHQFYIETIHAPQYAAKADKEKIIRRIGGIRQLQQALTNLLL